MAQRFDLLAISLLFFTVVLVIAVAVDPKGFALQDWQPLMAAILALGGGAVVYRSATLAYRAAMAKVDLDRGIDQRETRRKQRGIFLRLTYAMHVMGNEASNVQTTLAGPQIPGKPVEIDPTQMKFRTADALEEAWSALDAFLHPSLERSCD